MTPFRITFKGYLAPHICVRLVSTRWYMVWNEGKYVVHLPTAQCYCSQVSKIIKKDIQKFFYPFYGTVKLDFKNHLDKN